jgi:hypothetical protein
MARPDKVIASFRGVVGSVALTGQFGREAAGDKDLIFVKADTDGTLIVAGEGEAEGVVWTPEGKADPTVANFNVAAIGTKVTVFTIAAFTDWVEDTDLAVGDTLYAAASGDMATVAPTTIQLVGQIYANDQGDDVMWFNITPLNV